MLTLFLINNYAFYLLNHSQNSFNKIISVRKVMLNNSLIY